MNRLSPPPAASICPPENVEYRVEFARYSIGDQPDEPVHSLFRPLHYEAGYAYPLVVWLHGPHDDERQLLRVMPSISMRNFAAIAPRGIRALKQDGLPKGHAWSYETSDDLVEADRRVSACVELASTRLNIAAHRIFLAGYGSGGTMAVRLALNNPGQFAGAVTLGGPFPLGDRPLRCLNQIRALPIFVGVGEDSKTYSQDRVCHDLRVFHAAGMSIHIRQYPVGDDLTTIMLSDLNRWMMEVICPAQAAQPADAGSQSGR